MVMAAFIADALSLGVHWVYNTDVIVKKFGRVETFLEPKIASYHRGKPAGAFTHFKSDHPYAEWFEEGVDSAGLDTVTVIKDMGQMCEIEAAFPATVHLVAKYENDLTTGLIENVMAGGDSSARGLLAGMLLGAYNGVAMIPSQWQKALVAEKKISALLAAIDA